MTNRGTGQFSRYSDTLRAGLSVDRIPVWAKFSVPVLPGLGPNQPPAKWVPDPFPHVVERPRCGDDHPPPSSAEAKERVELYLYSSTVSS